MTYALSYVSFLVVFAAMDAVWLGTNSNSLYRATLGDIMLENLKILPGVVFYLMYPIGIVVFASVPALKSGSVVPALTYGALFGFLAYGTYDLTNLATLRNWSVQLTVLDMAWGTFASAVASAASYFIVRSVLAWWG